MSIAIIDPVATQDTVTGAWMYTASLTLPDGGAGALQEQRSAVAHQLYKAVITADVLPSKWATPPTATPAQIAAYISATPECSTDAVLAYIASTAGPVSDVDVPRFLGGIAAIEEYAAQHVVADATTSSTGPDLTT